MSRNRLIKWKKNAEAETTDPYAGFSQIDGRHQWQESVPDGYILYNARILRGSKVAYFNFPLAKEMGLIPKDHPHKLSKQLEKILVETFALQIINEYDVAKNKKFSKRDIKPYPYMATRYLQLQHSNKTGATSGDGRSIWNGSFKNGRYSWDLSSCGTGATRLSPHFAQTGKPVRTGDPSVCYGSGWAEMDEGLSAAIMSEIFHSRGILTERTLVIIRAPKGNAINVRTARNLLRPSHLFLPLKQNNQLKLRRALDCYIRRQIENGEWRSNGNDRYEFLLNSISSKYARFAAKLEDEYIFHWLDWDGDNMLTDGGIIDYGSIRQFGLFHHHYRYDDVDRFSTNIKEQKNKARALVQTFSQLVHFAKNGQRMEIAHFSKAESIKNFDKEFHLEQLRLFLTRVGYSKSQGERLLRERKNLVERFFRLYRYFAAKESVNSWQNLPDGINRPVAFDVKKLLRQLSAAYANANSQRLNPSAFVELMTTPYTPKRLKNPQGAFAQRIELFQQLYWKLLQSIQNDSRRQLSELVMRSQAANRNPAVTGDAIIFVVESLCRKFKKMPRAQFISLVEKFILSYCAGNGPNEFYYQTKASSDRRELGSDARASLEKLIKLVDSLSHTI